MAPYWIVRERLLGLVGHFSPHPEHEFMGTGGPRRRIVHAVEEESIEGSSASY
jgi:hypothetical protein